jgi:type VI secretion system VasD/TssJ family lipoprotein
VIRTTKQRFARRPKVDVDKVWRHSWVRWALFVALGVLGTGCPHRVGFRCELPPPLFVTFSASGDVNPSEAGEALPTLVRVFQLSSMVKAEAMEARDFWERPAEALGADLLAQEEFTLEPGERTSRWVNRRGPTNYLVAVALFRKPTATSWRTVVPLSQVDESGCPADAPGPRTGNPGPDDVRISVSLREYEILGGRLGVYR